jgi:hypothetical protein
MNFWFLEDGPAHPVYLLCLFLVAITTILLCTSTFQTGCFPEYLPLSFFLYIVTLLPSFLRPKSKGVGSFYVLLRSVPCVLLHQEYGTMPFLAYIYCKSPREFFCGKKKSRYIVSLVFLAEAPGPLLQIQAYDRQTFFFSFLLSHSARVVLSVQEREGSG